MTARMIDLTIKTLDSQNHKFRVPDSFTILEFKQYISEPVNVAVVQQRLIFCGRVLSNETTLAEIGIDGKVMHLVQKVPRLSTTTSGSSSSSSTTTNTNSRSSQNGGPGFRGWHTHDPDVLFGAAIGIPSEFMHARDLPRLINARNHGTGNRVSLAMDMIRKSNEILNRLENPQSTGQSSATDVEQFPERTQAEDTPENLPAETTAPEPSVSASSVPASSVPASSAPESSVPEPSASESSASIQQSDPDSVNVSYEVDETFPNTVVVTIDATHHMRIPPGLLRHMNLQTNNSQSTSQSATERNAENETSVPETTPVVTNQSPGYQATGTLPSFDQSLRNDRQTSENRSSTAINDRRRLKELIDQLNKLNARLQPFYAIYCQFINEDPQFSTTEGENGSHRAQTVFNNVSKVMHYISHVYHAISDLRVSFNRPPPRSFQSRPCLLQGTILHTAHSVTTTTTAPPPSTQQPTSTQTTSTSQSIPSVRAFRLDFVNPDGSLNGTLNETPIVSSSGTTTETNISMTVNPNIESHIASEFPSETPHGVELMFDLAPGTIRIDAVEAAFVTPNASGPSQPTSVSQPSSSGETSNNVPMPIDWMDQMIDVISSGVRRPFTADQLDWSSMPTTSTRTPRVTPRTTDSSSTSNPPSQGLNRGQWDTSPRMDPFLPCSSHHFESNLRPMVLARRSTQGAERSSSSVNSSNSTTDTSSPTSPNEVRPFSGRRTGRPRTRYVQDSDGFLSGIHPILSWGRNLRNNIATTSGTLNGQTAGQNIGLTDSLAGQIRVGMDSVFDTLEREGDFDRTRGLNVPPLNSSGGIDLEPEQIPQQSRQSNELLLTPVGEIPYFRGLQGRSILIDLFMMITRNWTFLDMLNINIIDDDSSIYLNPASRNNEEVFNFIIDRVMLNQEFMPHYIDEAANRIFQEFMPYIEIFQCSVPSRSNINVSESFRSCIVQNLHEIIDYCDQIRSGAPNDIISRLAMFGERLLSLVVYCCNSRAVFRLSVIAIMQFMPIPAHLHRFLANEVRMNIDQYWNIMASIMMGLSVIDYIVPANTVYEGGNSSRVNNGERSSNPTLSSSETSNEPLPEVVIGSQEWHHNVPSEWVPVIARDSQRQRRQGTQPPYSDAYLSGMPNKRRKIVTSSKPQGPLSQIIAKNLEVAMGAAGVAVNKEVTASVGADTSVQNAYTERIRAFGRSGIETHPDFCPVRYPNASKFFYDHNHPN